MLITDEYRELIDKKLDIENEIQSMPVGYISIKRINGKEYYYLQRREGNKIVSRYLSPDTVDEIKEKIKERKLKIEKLSEIENRCARLEKAADLLDHNMYCDLVLYKESSGMDILSKEEKEKCSSFAMTLNAIEGVSVSKETKKDINEWIKGKKDFIYIFDRTLKKYGFPAGGKS